MQERAISPPKVMLTYLGTLFFSFWREGAASVYFIPDPSFPCTCLVGLYVFLHLPFFLPAGINSLKPRAPVLLTPKRPYLPKYLHTGTSRGPQMEGSSA